MVRIVQLVECLVLVEVCGVEVCGVLGVWIVFRNK